MAIEITECVDTHHPDHLVFYDTENDINQWCFIDTGNGYMAFFDTKEEAFSYINSIRHKGKVMELYYINNYYKDHYNSVLNVREVKEKINTFV